MNPNNSFEQINPEIQDEPAILVKQIATLFPGEPDLLEYAERIVNMPFSAERTQSTELLMEIVKIRMSNNLQKGQ